MSENLSGGVQINAPSNCKVKTIFSPLSLPDKNTHQPRDCYHAEYAFRGLKRSYLIEVQTAIMQKIPVTRSKETFFTKVQNAITRKSPSLDTLSILRQRPPALHLNQTYTLTLLSTLSLTFLFPFDSHISLSLLALPSA